MKMLELAAGQREIRRRTIMAMLAALGVVSTAAVLPAQTTKPAAARSKAQIDTEIQATTTALEEALGGLSGLAEPQRRAEAAPKAIPLARKMIADFNELEAQQPDLKPQLVEPRQQFLSIMLALGDKPTQDTITAEANSGDAAVRIHGQTTQLMTRWLTSGHDSVMQKPIVDELQKLDEANIDSSPLTIFNMTLSETAASPDLKNRLELLAANTMKNPVADRVKEHLSEIQDQDAQIAAADKKLKALEGQPLIVKGKTVDGKDFSTDIWKGKVVIVDFWATWCPPCRAELPGLKKLYEDNHARGLEVLGVSNDYDASKLTDFTKQENMPWPQLLDAAAAADHQWNSVTSGYGIYSIPTVFLIDKKGICRSVAAQDDVSTLVAKFLSE